MVDFPNIVYAIQLEATNPWIYTVIAVILGLLHPFEPGPVGAAISNFLHGKASSMTEAGRNSAVAVFQDTALLWAVAIAALFSGDVDLGLQENEPYILLVSGGLIIVTAFRLFNLHQMKLEPSYLVSASAFAGLASPVPASLRAPPAAPGPPARPSRLSSLLPSPVALALLLLCMQIDFLDFGTSIAFAFCAGMAISMAGLSLAGRALRDASGSWTAYDSWSTWLPYLSVLLVISIGLLSFVHGLTDLGL